MRTSKVPSLYQQTSLNVDPLCPSALVDINVPPAAKRRRIETNNHNEETFTQSLASEASIHFRSSGPHYPRSILYRVVENRRVLELQAVDLQQDGTKPEVLLTLRFDFANQIRKGAIAFAEAEREGTANALVVFVPTAAGELFTLTLRTEAFVRPGFLTDTTSGSPDWCKVYKPNAFALKTPFKLLAKSEMELWASMNDGSLAKLVRPTLGT